MCVVVKQTSTPELIFQLFVFPEGMGNVVKSKRFCDGMKFLSVTSVDICTTGGSMIAQEDKFYSNVFIIYSINNLLFDGFASLKCKN